MKALQFSGGKDSLCTLYLLEHLWPELIVIWVNTGDAYPETVERMTHWKRVLPHFLEVKSNQPAQIEQYGWPSDVVPIRYTALARSCGASEGPLIQSYLNCCSMNIWHPMHDAIRKLGVTTVYRGTRGDDHQKGPIEPGQTIGGVTYEMPIWEWTDEDVFGFLRDKDDVPYYYELGEVEGRDCKLCTAYRDKNQERPRRLPEPFRTEFERRVTIIARLIDEESRTIPL